MVHYNYKTYIFPYFRTLLSAMLGVGGGQIKKLQDTNTSYIRGTKDILTFKFLNVFEWARLLILAVITFLMLSQHYS